MHAALKIVASSQDGRNMPGLLVPLFEQTFLCLCAPEIAESLLTSPKPAPSMKASASSMIIHFQLNQHPASLKLGFYVAKRAAVIASIEASTLPS